MRKIQIIGFICFALMNLSYGETSGDSIENKISQITSILKTIPNSAIPDASSPASERIYDQNFKIVAQIRDKLRESLENHRDTLIGAPHSMHCRIEPIRTFIAENREIFSDKDVIDSVAEDLNELSNTYQKFFLDIQNVVTLLRIIDAFTSNELKIIDKLSEKEHNIPLASKDIFELSNSFDLLKRYAPDSVESAIRNMISGASKMRFDNRPNIPSYLIFNFFKYFLENMEKKVKSLDLTCASFLRVCDKSVYDLKKICEFLKALQTSSSTPPNTIIYIENVSNTTQKLLIPLQKNHNDWKGYRESVSILVNETIKAIREGLAVEKDTKIFDFVSSI